ncbi:hypothetical protein F4808DRAFT_268155 [Astrocystis sublimbata]|nr:hypothetical protein F4808DRAFT_268155 [Astrocystis sublimbata]
MSSKSKRVRTGCLTCRERHLKCDEEVPECRNCRKSNRECKRGVRLNFIDLTCKAPPHIPHTDEWTVAFEDESRLVASEYRGGLERYAKRETHITILKQQDPTDASPPKDTPTSKSTDSRTTVEEGSSASTIYPQTIYYHERGPAHQDISYDTQMPSRKSSSVTYAHSISTVNTTGYGGPMTSPFGQVENTDNSFRHRRQYDSSDISTAPSVAGVTDAEPQSATRGPGSGHTGIHSEFEDATMVLRNDSPGERGFLDTPEEMHFMQVFVSEVGLWMDSLDKEKHFSRLIPYHALKCPMLLNALLACGVKHLTLTQQYSDEKALFYYDTATTQLLRSLQNPERNTAECAATAVVLNVYEIMSEKPTQRMSHIAGARALIRECGWNATSSGLGAACFWLNVGMELLSCLAFNWQTAWDPETWGVNMDFDTEKDLGSEEIWVHRIFFIVAKIANFRASVPKFQEINPADEQIRFQARMAEWSRLKGMCDRWNTSCPRPMHPFGYVPPTAQSTGKGSLFPNVWLIKRAAVVGRLYYHMAQCVLAQTDPSTPPKSKGARESQQYHAHQVCGIVAHNKDRGVASVSIRSLALVSEVLTDGAEQQEVVDILERIDRETGWKLGDVVKGLKKKWEQERHRIETPSLTAQMIGRRGSKPAPPLQPPGSGRSRKGSGSAGAGASSNQKQPIDRVATSQRSPLGSATGPQQQMMLTPVMQVPVTTAPQQMQPVVTSSNASSAAAAPGAASQQRPMMRVNPLSFADFSLPNHPYQNWYEPPSRSNSYHSHGLL